MTGDGYDVPVTADGRRVGTAHVERDEVGNVVAYTRFDREPPAIDGQMSFEFTHDDSDVGLWQINVQYAGNAESFDLLASARQAVAKWRDTRC